MGFGIRRVVGIEGWWGDAGVSGWRWGVEGRYRGVVKAVLGEEVDGGMCSYGNGKLEELSH